jgi:cation transport ATPase
MSLLAHLLQFLRFLETLLEFLEFLTTPIGLVALAGLIVYCPLCVLGLDAPTAMTVAGSVALTLSCILIRPEF